MTGPNTFSDTPSSHLSNIFAKLDKVALHDQHFSKVNLQVPSKFTDNSEFVNHDNPVCSLEFHPTGAYVVYTRADGSLNLWKLKSDRTESYKPLTQDSTKESINSTQSCISWSPFTGFLFATVNGSNVIRVYDASTGANIKSLNSDDECEYNLCLYDPSGKWLAAVTQDNQISLFDVDAEYQLAWKSSLNKTAHTSQFVPKPANDSPSSHVTSFIWSHDSTKIYAAFDSGKIEIYDVLATGIQGLIGVSGHTGPVNCMRLDQTGSYLIAGGEDTICSIWDLASMCCTLTINDFPDSIRDMDLSHDGSLLALSSPSCTHIYTLEERASIHKIEFDSKVSRPKFRFYPGHSTFILTTEKDLVSKYHRPDPADEANRNGIHNTTAADKKPRPDRRSGNGGRRRDADAPLKSRFVRRSARR
ncbi:LAFA_0G02828g1_1 [Lachancea sp. 'fantastica']|nr:LAFA_0G02828g1_1 [Lachancea sp. 'fantastica']